MIKASSMHTDPKGRIPPMSIVTMLFICQGASGTIRAICLVLVGTSMVDVFSPRKAPTKTSGAEIQTHSKKRTMIVKKLTAVAAPAKLKKMLRRENMQTKRPGKAVAVTIEFIFQFFASQNL